MKHVYSKLAQFNQWIFLVLSGLFTILGLGFFIGFISLLVGNKVSSAVTLFWNFIGLAVWSPFVFVFMSYLHSDLVVSDEGIQTRFLFKDLDINWEDIVEVKLSKPFGLRAGHKANLLIVRNGLTWFHRIYGIIYGQINQPALLIWSNISEYDTLMKKVFKKRRKK
jgi:hypothetical protein